MAVSRAASACIVTHLPNGIPESYVSDTWLYGNVRNGTQVGLSTMSLTGFYYLRNNRGQLLIDPATGLPIRSNAVSGLFIDGGSDRHPGYTIGVGHTTRYTPVSTEYRV